MAACVCCNIKAYFEYQKQQKFITQILLDSSKQGHLLIPKHLVFSCIKAFHNVVPYARNVQSYFFG